MGVGGRAVIQFEHYLKILTVISSTTVSIHPKNFISLINWQIRKKKHPFLFAFIRITIKF